MAASHLLMANVKICYRWGDYLSRLCLATNIVFLFSSCPAELNSNSRQTLRIGSILSKTFFFFIEESGNRENKSIEDIGKQKVP